MKKKVIYLSLLVVALGIIIIPINIKIKKANVYESMVVVPDIDSYKTLTLEDIATNQINENVEKKILFITLEKEKIEVIQNKDGSFLDNKNE